MTRPNLRGVIMAGEEERGCDVAGTWPVCSKTGGNTEQGLCDMAGNVAEWTYGDYTEHYSSEAQTNPTDSCDGYERVRRGGSGWVEAGGLTTTGRVGHPPSGQIGFIGFRPVRQVL